MASIMTVFYYPKLKLPDKEQFQLFKASHIFEKYELVYKRYFGFEKDEQQDISYKMPLRFVWGIKPLDQGDFLDPQSKGKIAYDKTSEKYLGKCFSFDFQNCYNNFRFPLCTTHENEQGRGI